LLKTTTQNLTPIFAKFTGARGRLKFNLDLATIYHCSS